MSNITKPGELWGEHQNLIYNNDFEYLLFTISTQTDHNGEEHILHLCFNLETAYIGYDTMNYRMFINRTSKLL